MFNVKCQKISNIQPNFMKLSELNSSADTGAITNTASSVHAILIMDIKQEETCVIMVMVLPESRQQETTMIVV